MTKSSAPTLQQDGLWRRHGGWLIGAALVLALLLGLWRLLSDTASQRRETAPTAVLTLPPPPPPPPEPEKLPEPEPQKVEPQITEVAPQPAESNEKPMDDAPESPSETAAAQTGDPVTMDAAGEAGSDAFAVGAGRGGGMSGAGAGGGGLGAGSYNRYVASMLQNALARDARTRHLVFADIRVDLWLDADGRTVRVQLVQGTGTERIDDTVLAFLRELDRLDERPPASARFPIRVSMKGSRP